MSSAILPISGPTAVAEGLKPAGPARSADAAPASGGFQDALAAAIGAVESSGQAASQAVAQFLSGEGGEVHTAALATERAELTFDLFLQTRNKVVSAYQEIMRMQI